MSACLIFFWRLTDSTRFQLKIYIITGYYTYEGENPIKTMIRF